VLPTCRESLASSAEVIAASPARCRARRHFVVTWQAGAAHVGTHRIDRTRGCNADLALKRRTAVARFVD